MSSQARNNPDSEENQKQTEDNISYMHRLSLMDKYRARLKPCGCHVYEACDVCHPPQDYEQ